MLERFFKRKNKSNYPSNEFERTIVKITTDGTEWENFYSKLLWVDLIVITDGAEPKIEGDEASIRLVALDSGHIPVFTSIDRIYDQGVIKEKVPVISVKGQDLLDFTKGSPIVINPYSAHVKELQPEEIENLLEGRIDQTIEELKNQPSVYELQELENLFVSAIKRQEKLIYIDGYRKKSLDIKTEQLLLQSIADFERIVQKVPHHWQSYFAKAKAFQRLGEHQKALDTLNAAMKIEPKNHLIPLEASVEAVNLKDLDKALMYSKLALKIAPKNHVLHGNHAINLLVAGRNDEAQETINEGLQIKKNDRTNQHIKQLIEAVVSGEKSTPTFEDLLGS